jgi:SAM-dependent methyltransferase
MLSRWLNPIDRMRPIAGAASTTSRTSGQPSRFSTRCPKGFARQGARCSGTWACVRAAGCSKPGRDRERRIVGIDPTRALVEQAHARARDVRVTDVSYAVGDIRKIDWPDNTFDAAFCDKILIHVSPILQAIGELVRVTRPGGRIGAVEWFSQGMAIAADYPLTRQVLDGSAPAGALNPLVPLELEHLLGDAGLQEIHAGSVLAECRRYLPSLKVMLPRRVQQAVDLGAISMAAGARWLEELQSRDERGQFYWAAVVRWAAGTKP